MGRLILFDWANVLLDCYSDIYNIRDAQRDIAAHLRPENAEEMVKIFSDDRFWTCCGAKLDDLIKSHMVKCGCRHTVGQFKACYLEHYKKVPWFENTVNLAGQLADSGCVKTGILSTLCEMDLQLLKNKLPLDKFSHLFFSFQLGMQKPDPGIYRAVQSVCGYRPRDIFFIDDRPENTLRAGAAGWNTLAATGNEFETIRQKCLAFAGQGEPER